MEKKNLIENYDYDDEIMIYEQSYDIFISFDDRDWYVCSLRCFFGLILIISSKVCSNETKAKFWIIHTWNFIFNPIQDRGQKAPSYHFFPVTSTNIGISPQKLSDF